MTNIPTGFVIANKKKYSYFITDENAQSVLFQCDGANIHQRYLKEDLATLLQELPEMILDEKAFQNEQKEKESVIRFRVQASEKRQIEAAAKRSGFPNVSQYLRHVALHEAAL